MKKQIKGLVVAAMMVLALPLQAFAASDASTTIHADGNKADVSVTLQREGAGEGVTSLQMTLDVKAQIGSLEQSQVHFQFNESLPGTVHRYTYNQENNTLTIYVAGANSGLFTGDKVDLGTVQVTSNTGDYVQASITAGSQEDSLKLLSGGTNLQTMTMQETTSYVEDGTTNVPSEPDTSTPVPPATQSPTEVPPATGSSSTQTTPSTDDNTTEKPSTGNGSNNANGTAATAVPQSGNSASTSKKPAASKSGSTVQEEAAASGSSDTSAASSSTSQSTAQDSSSQSSSSSQTAAQTNSSHIGVIIAGVVVAVVVIAGAVVIIRRRNS